MEKRKEKEIKYYDRLADDLKHSVPLSVGSHKFLMEIFKKKGKGKVVLDYGCGTGAHSIWLADYAKELIGIDLSLNSLNIAQERAEGNFLPMDCEQMDFKENAFDIVFDGGTFSSLDLEKALPEIARVLKPGGSVIGIETLGHNPILNLKRRLNAIMNKRSRWAREHIFRLEDFKKVKRYFNKIEVYFFHLTSWAAFPLLHLPGGRFLLRLLERADTLLINFFPFLKKYSFKIVFVFSEPKK